MSTSSGRAPAASSLAAGETTPVRVTDLGPRHASARIVEVDAPCGWVLAGLQRDPQDFYRWYAATKHAVAAAGVPRLADGRLIRVEVCTADRVRPLGPYLSTALACLAGLRDTIGVDKNVVPELVRGERAVEGVRLHITGEAR